MRHSAPDWLEQSGGIGASGALLSASHGFSRLRPTPLFAAAAALSMAGLSYAMRSIPIGTGYAVWWA